MIDISSATAPNRFDRNPDLLVNCGEAFKVLLTR